MRKRILIAVVGGPAHLSDAEMIELNNALKPLELAAVIVGECSGPTTESTAYEIQLPPPIEPCYQFAGHNKHKNQHWAKRNKNRKC